MGEKESLLSGTEPQAISIFFFFKQPQGTVLILLLASSCVLSMSTRSNELLAEAETSGFVIYKLLVLGMTGQEPQRCWLTS